jgi:hypothetical protein
VKKAHATILDKRPWDSEGDDRGATSADAVFPVSETFLLIFTKRERVWQSGERLNWRRENARGPFLEVVERKPEK